MTGILTRRPCEDTQGQGHVKMEAGSDWSYGATSWEDRSHQKRKEAN